MKMTESERAADLAKFGEAPIDWQNDMLALTFGKDFTGLNEDGKDVIRKFTALWLSAKAESDTELLSTLAAIGTKK